MRRNSSVACLVWLTLAVPLSEGFLLPSGRRTHQQLFSSSAPSSSSSSSSDTDEMRRDIETMRQEATRRLEALNQKLQEEHAQGDAVFRTANSVVASSRQQLQSPSDVAPPAPHVDELAEMREIESMAQETRLSQRIEADNNRVTITNTATSASSLLDNTRWRLMLNVGRENNTWMPKTWGISGERLLMNLEMEFTSEQLYEREEFLNGISGSKVLHVVNNELTVGPSMKEGSKRVRVRDGGWRVAKGEGPMGTDVLRFYIDLEEETRHQGSDVYCPAGRVYCTCGYFPMKGHDGKGVHGSLKEALHKEQQALAQRYEQLTRENEADTSMVSLDKLKRAKEMMDLRQKAERLNNSLNEVRVREPEKSLLRMSRNQQVGLTKEGGVCCKVNKGLAIEYHILGKFEIASIENREHSNYRDLLP